MYFDLFEFSKSGMM